MITPITSKLLSKEQVLGSKFLWVVSYLPPVKRPKLVTQLALQTPSSPVKIIRTRRGANSRPSTQHAAWNCAEWVTPRPIPFVLLKASLPIKARIDAGVSLSVSVVTPGPVGIHGETRTKSAMIATTRSILVPSASCGGTTTQTGQLMSRPNVRSVRRSDSTVVNCDMTDSKRMTTMNATKATSTASADAHGRHVIMPWTNLRSVEIAGNTSSVRMTTTTTTTTTTMMTTTLAPTITRDGDNGKLRNDVAVVTSYAAQSQSDRHR